jgi:hypothetical protein
MGRLLWDETALSLCSRIARPKKGLDRRAQWREEPSHPIVLGVGEGEDIFEVLAECAHYNGWMVKLWAVFPQCAQLKHPQALPHCECRGEMAFAACA